MKRLLFSSLILVLVAPLATQDLAVTVKDIEPFPYCAIAHEGPCTDMAAVIGELVGAMQAQGLFPQVRGPMVGVYYNSPADAKPEELRTEIWVPCAKN